MPDTTISFKVYILEENEDVEVRRFEVDQGVVTNYDYIRERLQYVFPRLRGKVFKLLWKDGEGDEVTISSDDELMIALSEIKGDLCKLIVRLPSQGEDSPPQVTAEVHFPMFSPCAGLSSAEGCPAMKEQQKVCSGCQKPLQGFRYKCLECLHYTHCSDCDRQALHPDHIMLRLSQNFPTLSSLVPKGIQIVKQHLVKGGRCVGSLGKAAYSHMWGEKEPDCKYEYKGKFGHRRHHKSHSRKHSHHRGENYESPIDLEGLINGFFGMFSPASGCPAQPMETDDSSPDEGPCCSKKAQAAQASQSAQTTQAPQAAQATQTAQVAQAKPEEKKTEQKKPEQKVPDAPAEPISVRQEDDFVDLSRENENGPTPNIAKAVRLLTEMGFKDEGRWLSSILERFDGDISKALDHLMQNPK